VPVRFLSDAQREQLSGFPAELDGEALDRFFTLSDADLAEVRRRHGDSNRLGWALQLCGLRMLGFCPDDMTSAPAVAVRFLSRQLGVEPGVLATYGVRAQTRTDHLAQVKSYLGFPSATPDDLERLGEWLAAEAMAQDRPIVLFHLACARLYELRLVRPGLTVIEQSLVGAARETARRETARRVAPLLTPERCRRLDGLLEVGADGATAKATWLRHFPVAATPGVMHDEMDKLVYLRELGAEGWDLGALPPRRVTILARWAQAASNQALAQSSAERRYPALLAFGVERLVGVVDGLVDLFDKLLADTNARPAPGSPSTTRRWLPPPTTRCCCWPRSSGCCWTPTSTTTPAWRRCSRRCPRTVSSLRWPTASGSPGRPTTLTSTCWATTTPGCASACPGSSICSRSDPSATTTGCWRASRSCGS
jgi:hypothetical protein